MASSQSGWPAGGPAPHTEENGNHFVDQVIPALVTDGALGEDVAVLSHDIRPVGGYGQDHWMSCTLKVALELDDRKLKTRRTVRLVAKYQANDPVWLDTAVSCRNEDHMYNQVAPFFQSLWDESSHGDPEPLGIFPKCYRASAGGEGATPLVVMEDMSADGFRLASSATALDGAHVFLTLQRLGRMHALSYGAKVLRKSDFLSLARQLQDAEFGESNRAYQTGFIGGTTGPGLRRLAARGDLDAATVEQLRRRLRAGRDDIPDGVFNVMLEARSPEEPLAVIAHGDFNRNNMMFKYDEATGRPVDVRFFDLQTCRYCSPAVDLSVFLFLNTTASQRAAHWDDFFVSYYDGLTTALRRLLSGSSTDPTLSPTMEMPSLAAIRADFARHALYGFVICSYFLPVMQAGPQEGSEGSTEEMYAVVRSIPDKFEAGQTMASFLEYLGEDGENTVADLLLEFVDRGLVGL
ncbi:EcKinase 7 [Frankliniella occidentalis]|uniref:Uncharacterized protein LOC113213833 isoform X1 n=2 Tax=Frankliniella occidentalis TaxID=133901 RepID=A0A6J1TAY3_FRAOC|nr:uncharacterized protein LOC113213833 isoform X1 [Frankliniella occidentalis]KAE8748954.1 EcKinase 7 [Frankliniella occidentalis]